MNKTKLKIINIAVAVLNKKGLANVSLKMIADEAQISQGNLTYHFKHKVDLMKAIHQQMMNEMEGVIRPLGLVGLDYLENSILYFLQFQEKYQFFFLDIVEISRTYPKISERHAKIVERRMEEGRALMNYYIGGGWLVPEPEEGIYDTIIQNIWFVNTFWLGLQMVMQHSTVKFNQKKIMNMIWTNLTPYFTEKGKEDFKKLRNK